MSERDMATIETFISNVNYLALGNSPRWIYVCLHLAGYADRLGKSSAFSAAAVLNGLWNELWFLYLPERVGERGRNRTFNLLIKSQLLCQLSYAPAGDRQRKDKEDYSIRRRLSPRFATS